MSNLAAPRFVVLAAIDESPAATRVIAHAGSLARTTAGGELHLLYVGNPTEDATATNSPHAITVSGHGDRLDRQAREAQRIAGVTVVGHFREGDPAGVIVQTAASLDADLVVVGTHDPHGLERWLLGSVAAKVVARAACPVFVVRAKSHHAVHAPEVEPPCPQCLATQRASGGAKLWCGRHSEHHPRAHLHYSHNASFGEGSNLIQPTDHA